MDDKKIDIKESQTPDKKPASLLTREDSTKFKSEAKADNNRFFHSVTTENKGINQTTNVTVHVEQPKDDCLTGCFSFLGSCCKK